MDKDGAIVGGMLQVNVETVRVLGECHNLGTVQRQDVIADRLWSLESKVSVRDAQVPGRQKEL